GSFGRSTGRGRRQARPAARIQRRTVSRLTGTPWSSHSTTATASQHHRLRARPKAAGGRLSTQATATAAHRPARGGRAADPPTAATPPARKRRCQRAIVLLEVYSTAAIN